MNGIHTCSRMHVDEGQFMIYTRLKDRLNPPIYPDTFIRDRTTDEFKNQILSIIHEYYDIGRNPYDMNFDIADYSDDVMTKMGISNCIEPLNPGYYYSKDSLFLSLKEKTDYDFFELLDCVINTLYSDHNVRYLPIFQEFVEDLNKSLLLHGIDYIIYEGQLVYRTEKTIFESAIDPCFYSLKRHKLLDADKYLREAFNSFKKSDYNLAIVQSVMALENTIQNIVEHKKIKCESNAKLHEKITAIMNQTDCDFLADKIGNQYIQMDKIFQVAMSSRNPVSHGSRPFVASLALVEHTLNIVCSDILFLIRITYES